MKVGIVLSGGGAKGAFEVGALSILLPYLKRNGHELVAISGTSIGAFNGAFVAAKQFHDLEKIWYNWGEKNCELVRPPFVSPYVSLMTHGYMFGTPSRFLRKKLDAEALLKSNIKYTNVSIRAADGFTRVGGNIQNKSTDIIYQEILASMAAIPVTPAVMVDGHAHVDGGFRDTIPVRAMLDSVEKPDRIYVIAVNPKDRIWNASLVQGRRCSFFKKVNFALNDILWDEAHRNDIEEGKRKMKNDKNYIVVYPEYAVTTGANFSQTKLRDAIAHGKDVMSRTLGFEGCY